MREWNGEEPEVILTLCRNMYELSTDGFLLVDKQARIIYINPAYCRQLGVKQADAIGEPVRDIISNTAIPEMLANKRAQADHNVLWKVNPGQYTSQEKCAVVSRWVVRDLYGHVVGAVGHVKFISETLRLSRAIQEMNDELDYLKSEVIRLGSERYNFEHIIGESAAITKTKVLACKAVSNDFPILITGESGTGKEVFANAIHYAGARRGHPIVRVNCAAIPADLFESELFGYSEGAFTGAKKGGKKGKILLANAGTLFLDEIGDMPLPMQAKLLRVLQEQELEVVGGEAPISIDVRIIAATNKNIMAEIAAGRFRVDLYYRLNVVELHVPPLRERMEDVIPLAVGFLKGINLKYATHASFSPEIGPILQSYSWPGNVRELRNVVERSYMLADGKRIDASHLSIPLQNRQAAPSRLDGNSFSQLKDEFERELIMEALQRCGGNVKKCAALLNVHRSTLYNKLSSYQMDLSDQP